jgi:hypothetical protein
VGPTTHPARPIPHPPPPGPPGGPGGNAGLGGTGRVREGRGGTGVEARGRLGRDGPGLACESRLRRATRQRRRLASLAWLWWPVLPFALPLGSLSFSLSLPLSPFLSLFLSPLLLCCFACACCCLVAAFRNPSARHRHAAHHPGRRGGQCGSGTITAGCWSLEGVCHVSIHARYTVAGVSATPMEGP